MNREDVVRMAQEAGLHTVYAVIERHNDGTETVIDHRPFLERFAALVATSAAIEAKEQEPVAWMGLAQVDQIESLAFDKSDLREYAFITPLYTAPQKHEWVGLTDEERDEYNHLGPDMEWVIKEVEAKLKEKNT